MVLYVFAVMSAQNHTILGKKRKQHLVLCCHLEGRKFSTAVSSQHVALIFIHLQTLQSELRSKTQGGSTYGLEVKRESRSSTAR